MYRSRALTFENVCQYCALCEGFIHEILHVCPGCEDKSGGKAAAEGSGDRGAGDGGGGGDVVMGEGSSA
jgi:hypothetical protein